MPNIRCWPIRGAYRAAANDGQMSTDRRSSMHLRANPATRNPQSILDPGAHVPDRQILSLFMQRYDLGAAVHPCECANEGGLYPQNYPRCDRDVKETAGTRMNPKPMFMAEKGLF